MCVYICVSSLSNFIYVLHSQSDCLNNHQYRQSQHAGSFSKHLLYRQLEHIFVCNFNKLLRIFLYRHL